jgi:hypothetical protein
MIFRNFITRNNIKLFKRNDLKKFLRMRYSDSSIKIDEYGLVSMIVILYFFFTSKKNQIINFIICNILSQKNQLGQFVHFCLPLLLLTQ